LNTVSNASSHTSSHNHHLTSSRLSISSFSANQISHAP